MGKFRSIITLGSPLYLDTIYHYYSFTYTPLMLIYLQVNSSLSTIWSSIFHSSWSKNIIKTQSITIILYSRSQHVSSSHEWGDRKQSAWQLDYHMFHWSVSNITKLSQGLSEQDKLTNTNILRVIIIRSTFTLELTMTICFIFFHDF